MSPLAPLPEASQPRILIHPTAVMLDTPLQIRLMAFPPHRAIAVRLTMDDAFGGVWGAQAVFLTDEHGSVDVHSQAPIAGSYTGVDPMGLIWSMTLVSEAAAGAAAPAAGADPGVLPPARTVLTAQLDGHPIAEMSFERWRMAPNTQRTVVRDRGVVGTLFCPADGGPYPGILLLGGSEGGLHELDAALLAAHGYAVLALAYFGMEGIAPFLVDIPLEYFGTALALLREHPQVRGDRLGVIGGSRGGEVALLLGATFPSIRAVVSVVGSGVITQGIGEGALLEKLNNALPAWTIRGQPLPFLPNVVTPPLHEQVRAGEPVELALAFLPGLEDSAALAAATIPVERIQGAALLISAGDDRMWPSQALSEVAMERFAKHRHPYPFRHLTYPQAGHMIAPPPYGPSTQSIVPGPGVMFRTGGTPQANAEARADAWRQTLQFFADHLAS